jgi:hypothetical protein
MVVCARSVMMAAPYHAYNENAGGTARLRSSSFGEVSP